ncbi:nitroreductase family protein [Streptomyces sp. M19]
MARGVPALPLRGGGLLPERAGHGGERGVDGAAVPDGGRRGPPAAVVAVVGRPWQSMRKYGRRGHLYTQLDGRTRPPTSRWPPRTRATGRSSICGSTATGGRAAGPGGLCREPQALISLADPDRSGAGTGARRPPPPTRSRCRCGGTTPRHRWRSRTRRSGRAGARSVRSAPPATAEAARQFPGPDALGTGPGTSPGTRPGTRLGTQPGARSGSGSDGRGRRRAGRPARGGPARRAGPSRAGLPRARAGAQLRQGFRPLPLSAAAFGEALAGLGAGLTLDCVDGPAVGLRVLVRAVDGVPPGSYAYAPGGHALRPVGEDPGTAEAVLAACMNQGVVRDTAALLAFHAPVRSVVARRGWQGLVEVHFHAASAAQRICLAARAAGVGATCLGGFDSDRVADLVGLDPADEVVYTLAAGVPDESAVKWDRAPVAYSHGFVS